MEPQPDLRRLAETEYVGLVDPAHARETEFGTFTLRPEFPDRRDANQLCRVRCKPGDAQRLLDAVEDLYAGTGLAFRKVSGHEPETWDSLAPRLEAEGWQVFRAALKVQRTAPTRPRSEDLQVRTVDARSRDLEALYTTEGQVDRGFSFARGESARLGGEHLLGYADGEPACCTGWYVVGRVARFRHVYTAPWARGRGYAGTLIQHVQSHPTVRAQDALVILVGEDGPAALYDALGFRTAGVLLEALRLPEPL